MALYEHIFLARQDATAAQVDALTDQFKSVIAGGGGKIGKTEYWGLKSLTYRIRKNRKAHFTLFNIDAPPAAVAEMERQMSINEDIIRFMTIKVEALEDGPSAQMRRRDDRDSRDGPRDGRDGPREGRDGPREGRDGPRSRRDNNGEASEESN